MKQPDVPKQPRCAVIAAALLLAAGALHAQTRTARNHHAAAKLRNIGQAILRYVNDTTATCPRTWGRW